MSECEGRKRVERKGRKSECSAEWRAGTHNFRAFVREANEERERMSDIEIDKRSQDREVKVAK